MSAQYRFKKLVWWIAAITSSVLLLMAVCLPLFVLCTEDFIDSISLDDSSEWAKYFLSKSGFSTFRIRSHVASRRHVDDVSIVGTNRPKEWFERMGFEDIYELEMVMRTPSKIFPDDRTVQPVMGMCHKKAPDKDFLYYPKTGVLLSEAVSAATQN